MKGLIIMLSVMFLYQCNTKKLNENNNDTLLLLNSTLDSVCISGHITDYKKAKIDNKFIITTKDSIIQKQLNKIINPNYLIYNNYSSTCLDTNVNYFIDVKKMTFINDTAYIFIINDCVHHLKDSCVYSTWCGGGISFTYIKNTDGSWVLKSETGGSN
jgi:hypothetical protein